ncbi:type I-C CRISPR-associated protein Cas8c/Csd1 [Frankia sp. CNm7]|uniref:Type I-C CRISPR-associated protein Cas8c/Csd1 n=1 Tax=Frankia nepalensis TaxID=1836974 RepID=A0A937UU80_9ACTN|nr:type I-C CRISPR-associated protein Cas8c/Csd1 [Frankia nepalensis]MBL7499886.1 type I-C CRISPR-associated protein Cas8c/Csd1 [Frankia nepalensis]MBL7512296.1 type I-C CRISPR-associated protein Cas8c/Csd1 [Frankia nepalensis]MBL7516981.1 type I-C CRISPR-associated protein Cas8c/Csd1 [Frankia nepalensis]MBL7631980.1 type I-C CRISPR-associated protein Cas8c/Csd1 [Frankia nepalensis]
MLLQRLVEFERPRDGSDDDLPPFFQIRPMRWGVRISEDGKLLSPQLRDLTDPEGGARGKLGTSRPVPYLARAAGISPLLGADDLQYVLGWADEKAKPARVDGCHQASVDLIERWANAAPESQAAQAVRRFYRSGAFLRVEQPEKWTSKQGVVFLVGDQARWVTDDPSLRRFWATEVARRKAGGGTTDGEGGRSGICLVCGQPGRLVDRFPQQLPRRLVPLTTQASAALVSANRRIHTYDFSDSLTTVPVCIGCAQASVANLQYLLDNPRHAMSAGGGDGRMTWWTIGAEFDITRILSQPDPAEVAELVRTVHTGRHAAGDLDSDRFCSVTIAGNVSRVMIRNWVDMPLGQLKTHIAAWFADHQLLGADPGGSGYVPLVRLELAAGRWEPTPGDRRKGAYARFDARGAARPDDVQRQLLRAALTGADLSPALFGHLLTRIRTDGHVDDPRGALLRLALVRRIRRSPEPERPPVPGPGLDPTNDHPAYLAGRIFAQLETIQYYAARVGRAPGDRLNTTFADRYLAGAIANPKIALVQGQQLAQPWLKKIGRGRPDQAFALSRDLGELFTLFDASKGLPGSATLDDQAMFILGYHHHRTDSIRKGRATNAATKTASAAEGPTEASADAAS